MPERREIRLIQIGIDPGKKGAVAWYVNGTQRYYDAVKMPPTAKQLHELLKPLVAIGAAGGGCRCTIEQVQVMGKKFGAKQALSYGQGYGEIIGVLTCLGVSIEEVRASVWKKKLHVTADKNTSILLCERLYPELDLMPGKCTTPQDGLAEAMLIAHYGITHGGEK